MRPVVHWKNNNNKQYVAILFCIFIISFNCYILVFLLMTITEHVIKKISVYCLIIFCFLLFFFSLSSQRIYLYSKCYVMSSKRLFCYVRTSYKRDSLLILDSGCLPVAIWEAFLELYDFFMRSKYQRCCHFSGLTMEAMRSSTLPLPRSIFPKITWSKFWDSHFIQNGRKTK